MVTVDAAMLTPLESPAAWLSTELPRNVTSSSGPASVPETVNAAFESATDANVTACVTVSATRAPLSTSTRSTKFVLQSNGVGMASSA